MSASGIAHFDLMPDELLSHVIYFTIMRDSCLFIEHGFRPPSQDKVNQEERLKRFPMDVHYPHCDVLTYYRTNIRSTQSEHIADWIFINSTNKRIRSLGKEIFFRTRPFAVSSSFADDLRAGTCKHMSLADQMLALEWIRDLTFVDNNFNSPSTLLKLPARVKAFPRLERCLVLYNFPLDRDIRQILEAKPTAWEQGYMVIDDELSMQGTTASFQFMSRFKEHLVRTGFPGDVKFGVSVFPVMSWERVMRVIEQMIFPTLEVKASLIKQGN